MNGGWQPAFMQRVEAWITLRTRARNVTVSVLDGSGRPVAVLPGSEIQAVADGFRIHLNGAGQPQSPWFVIRGLPAGRGSR